MHEPNHHEKSARRSEADDSPHPRAEELILEVYRQRSERASAGVAPSRVVMSREHYETIQRYHARLGDVPEGAPDYIERYRLFDLDICVEQVDRVRVE